MSPLLELVVPLRVMPFDTLIVRSPPFVDEEPRFKASLSVMVISPALELFRYTVPVKSLPPSFYTISPLSTENVVAPAPAC